ncbi:MAG: aminodeoxychorismate lyase [Cycloclasticus sp.]
MQPKLLINGEYRESISPLDRGFQYGDGLFETILVQSACPVFLAEHLDRLQKGCDVLGFPAVDRELISNELTSLINGQQHGLLKIVLSRGVGERGFLPPESPTVTRVVSFSPSNDAVNHALTSLALIQCETRLSRQPVLAGIKHLNQLERVLARRELGHSSAVEGLMLDTDGNVIEGTMSNLFIVKNDVLMTPKLDNSGVLGVIRCFLIQRAKQDGIDCKELELSLDDIKNADEIFMTNSLMPVSAINSLNIDASRSPKKIGAYAKWALDRVLKDTLRQIECHRQQ